MKVQDNLNTFFISASRSRVCEKRREYFYKTKKVYACLHFVVVALHANKQTWIYILISSLFPIIITQWESSWCKTIIKATIDTRIQKCMKSQIKQNMLFPWNLQITFPEFPGHFSSIFVLMNCWNIHYAIYSINSYLLLATSSLSDGQVGTSHKKTIFTIHRNLCTSSASRMWWCGD